MTEPNVRQLQRRLNLSWILMVLLAIALVMPTLKLWMNFGVSGAPRPVTPRGELADFEKTTVELFRNTSPSVVYLNTRAAVANRLEFAPHEFAEYLKRHWSIRERQARRPGSSRGNCVGIGRRAADAAAVDATGQLQ